MGLFSFLSKNKRDGSTGQGDFYSRSEGDAKPASKRKSSKAPKAGKTQDNDQPLDPVLPEKKRARRRLVGAVALVLAMIIGLPMILDSEPKPLTDDISIQIPSRDKPPAPDLMTSAPAVPAPASTTTPLSQPAPAGVSSAVPASASLGPHEQIVNLPPADKPQDRTQTAEVKPPRPDAKPAEPATAKPADKAGEKGGDKAAAKSDKSADKPSEKSAEKVSEKSTEKQVAKTDPKQDARAQAILEGKDTDAKPAKGGKFIVQVAALTSKDKVTELQGKLADAGFKPMLQTVPTDAGVTTRVRVGPFASKEEAESARAKLSKLGYNGKLLPL